MDANSNQDQETQSQNEEVTTVDESAEQSAKKLKETAEGLLKTGSKKISENSKAQEPKAKEPEGKAKKNSTKITKKLTKKTAKTKRPAESEPEKDGKSKKATPPIKKMTTKAQDSATIQDKAKKISETVAKTTESEAKTPKTSAKAGKEPATIENKAENKTKKLTKSTTKANTRETATTESTNTKSKMAASTQTANTNSTPKEPARKKTTRKDITKTIPRSRTSSKRLSRSSVSEATTSRKTTRRTRKPLVFRSDPALMLDRAIRAAKENQVEEALSLYSQTIKTYPDYIRAHVYHARFRASIGDRKRALREYNKALHKEPHDVEALFSKAEFLEIQNPPRSLNDSIKIYTKILELFHDSEDEHHKRHVALTHKRLKFCEARKLSIQASKFLKPGNSRAMTKAKKLLKKAFELCPEDKRNPMNLGFAHFHSKDFELACQYCEKALKADPKYARAMLVLGLAQAQLGHLMRSRDTLRICLRMSERRNDQEDARRNLKAVEIQLAKTRTDLLEVLTNPKNKPKHMKLFEIKKLLTSLTGDDIEFADLARKSNGRYTLLAFSNRNRYQVYQGPEGLKIVQDKNT